MAQRGKGHERSLARARAKREEERREASRRRRLIGLAVLLVGVFVVAGVVLAMTRGGDDTGDQFAADGDTSAEVTDPPVAEEQPAAESTELPEGCEAATPAGDDAPEYDAAPPMVIDETNDYRATVTTSCGEFTIDLYPDRAPTTVNNFVFLANEDFYDGVVFHRIVPGFVIQGGDPSGTGAGGPGYEFEDELAIPEAEGYDTGTVAMANSGPNTNGSQFFVVLPGGGPSLQPLYSIFGEVADGMDVVERIASVPLNGQSPTQPVVIVDVTIEEIAPSS